MTRSRSAVAVVKAIGEGDFETSLEQFPGKKPSSTTRSSRSAPASRLVVDDAEMLAQVMIIDRDFTVQYINTVGAKVAGRAAWQVTGTKCCDASRLDGLIDSVGELAIAGARAGLRASQIRDEALVATIG